MFETILVIAAIVIIAIVLFILIDKAGQPDPIPLLLKLVILLVALFAVARHLGYA